MKRISGITSSNGAKNMLKKYAISAAILSTILSGSAMAATVTGGSYTVQVTVAAGCVISTDIAAVNFGSASGAGAVPGTQSLTPKVTCTNLTPWGVHMT